LLFALQLRIGPVPDVQTMKRFLYLSLLLIIGLPESRSQCTGGISSFPYTEGFETTAGNWFSGGAGNDWAWGTPAKPVITTAGGGTKCWVVGGLTGGSYTNAEASWLQSPCFNFTNLQYPYVSFKVFWEMEQQFDGASFQYSVDNGSSWATLGIANYSDCLNKNWYNQNPVTYLSPLTSERQGWSGNKQPSAGSCRGGNGSNGWVTASQIIPGLAGRTGVLFRFIFGAGTICNNYDGFGIDDIFIGEAPPNAASFSYICATNSTVNFTNTSALCPTSFSWNFGDPVSGTNNTSTNANPSHTFSGPGKYTVSLTVNGSGNAPSTTSKDVTVVSVTVDMLQPADCQANNGGSLIASVTGTSAPLSLSWNTSPVQTTAIATNLAAGLYTVTVSGTDVCTATGTGKVETDFSCIGIFFPNGFTPNGDGRNDGFGPLGSLAALSNYRFSIYNRWGERVFFSTNPFEKWTGFVMATPTDGNVFAWMAEYNLPGKPKEFKKGTVVLIR
jgi:gliding motility-associated-like protein